MPELKPLCDFEMKYDQCLAFNNRSAIMVFSKPESEKRESARKSRRWNTTGAAAGNYEISIPKLLNSPSSKNRGDILLPPAQDVRVL